MYNKGSISRLYVPNNTQSLCGSRQKAKAPSVHNNLNWEPSTEESAKNLHWLIPELIQECKGIVGCMKLTYLNREEIFPVVINFYKH